MAEGHFGPLPLSDGEFPIRRGKFIDIETFGLKVTNIASTGGTFVGGDIYSDNWNGTLPLSLASRDSGASAGYGLDGSAGGAQFINIFADGGELKTLSILGTLTMGTGGLLRTAVSGQRIEMSNSTQSLMKFYNSAGTEVVDFEYENSINQLRISGKSVASNTYRVTAFAGIGMDTPGNITLETTTTGTSSYITLKARADGDEVVVFENGLGTRLATLRAISTTNAAFEMAVGSAALPSYTFLGDLNTGMYRDGANSIGWATEGTERMTLGTSNLTFSVAVLGAAAIKNNGAGTNSNPAFRFAGDLNTGMYRYGTDHVALTAGSVVVFRSDASETRLQRVYTETGSDTAVGVTSTGLMRRITSAKKYKKHIKYKDMEWLADIELKPVEYTQRSTGEGFEHEEKRLIGFIADDLADEEVLLGRFDNGEIEDFYDRGVMAVMAAKINRLEKEVKELKE